MEIKKLERGELIAIGGGVLLGIGLFLPWYHLVNSFAVLNGPGPKTLSGWQVHTIIRWLLLLAAAAPLILSYIIVRGHRLSWPRGEMTLVVAIAAFGLIVYNALIKRPGNIRSLVELRYGVFVALLGTVLMGVGAALRSSEGARQRKPPGTV